MKNVIAAVLSVLKLMLTDTAIASWMLPESKEGLAVHLSEKLHSCTSDVLALTNPEFPEGMDKMPFIIEMSPLQINSLRQSTD